jgi:hypothetical protein
VGAAVLLPCAAGAVLLLALLLAGVALVPGSAAVGAAADPHAVRVEVPAFDVRVVLEEGAGEALVAAGETVVVSAIFDGDGDAPPRTCDPFRAVYLGAAKVELSGEPWVASFRGVRVREDDLARLDDPDFHVSLNVFTGRRSAPNNLLWASSPAGRIEGMRGRTTEVPATLAGMPLARRRPAPGD